MYLKQSQEGLQASNEAAEIRLRADRKLGDMLAGMDLHGGDRKSKLHDATLKLADHGIEKTQSHRWQKQASVPEDEFEAWVSKTKAAEKELTAAALLKLAKSIDRDGLVEPIVVRKSGRRWQLIAGERRVRAIREHSSRKDILCRVVEADDLQARRMCAAENLQRDDLSAIETVGAIVEMLDAELIDSDGYEELGGDPVERVKTLLTKLDSDDRNGTDLFTNKFVRKVETIFASLPRPVEWQSFFKHDIPLVTKVSPIVREIATREKLNKSQTKALEEVAQASRRRSRRLPRSPATRLRSLCCQLGKRRSERQGTATRDRATREKRKRKGRQPASPL